MNQQGPGVSSLETCKLVQGIDPEQQGFDSVDLLSTGVQIYFTLSKDLQTQVGIFFKTAGSIEIWIQQSVIPENMLLQTKIIDLNVPSALGFLFFFLGLTTFFLKTVVYENRSAKSEALHEMRNWIDYLITENAKKARKSK